MVAINITVVRGRWTLQKRPSLRYYRILKGRGHLIFKARLFTFINSRPLKQCTIKTSYPPERPQVTWLLQRSRAPVCGWYEGGCIIFMPKHLSGAKNQVWVFLDVCPYNWRSVIARDIKFSGSIPCFLHSPTVSNSVTFWKGDPRPIIETQEVLHTSLSA